MIKPKKNEFVLRSGETYQFIKSIWHQTIKFIESMQPEGNVLEINQSGLNLSRLTSNNLIGSPLWKATWWNKTQQTQTDRPIKAPLRAIASLSHWVDEDLESEPHYFHTVSGRDRQESTDIGFDACEKNCGN